MYIANSSEPCVFFFSRLTLFNLILNVISSWRHLKFCILIGKFQPILPLLQIVQNFLSDLFSPTSLASIFLMAVVFFFSFVVECILFVVRHVNTISNVLPLYYLLCFVLFF